MLASPSAQGRKILIVDDSNYEQRIMMDGLAGRSYFFSSARNGEQGYQMAQLVQPDLILLDVRLPDMDGLAVCRLLKANVNTEHIPVIFVSGATEPHERTKGLNVGGVDYVTKPFSPDELAARIQIHLRLATRRASVPAAAPVHLPELVAEDVTVTAARRFIDEHLGDLPSLAEIARQVGTYREKLSPLFRAQTGMTIFEFIRHRRIARARVLLIDTRLDIQAIALLIGYENSGNFATAFRAVAGDTPRDYRRKHSPPSAHRTAQPQAPAPG